MKTVFLKLFGGRLNCIQFALKLAIKHFHGLGEPDMAVMYEKMLQEVEEQSKKSTPSRNYMENEYKMRYRKLYHLANNDTLNKHFWKGSLHECRYMLKHVFGLSAKEINKLEKKTLTKEELKQICL